jgi:hypothetical protein
MKEFVNLWVYCPGCHQEYQNDLRIDIVNKFVSFVRRQYPNDTPKQVEALYVKLCAFDSMLNRLQPRQKWEAGVTADVLLSLIDRMKNDASSPLPRGYSHMEAYAYSVHGHIALQDGTEESARRAVLLFERKLELNASIGYDEGVASAKGNIAIAKSMYEDSKNNEEVLKASQEVYELRVTKNGEGNEYTIDAGIIYAMELQQANRGVEARDLLMKLLATSKQVLGPHHSTTKQVEVLLEYENVRIKRALRL